VPWVGLTAVTIFAGAALQFDYFKSIGHVPFDLAALTSLAISTFAAALLMLVVSAACLVFPALVERFHASGVGKTSLKELDVLASQLLGASIFFSWSAYDGWSDCGSWPGYAFVAMPMVLASFTYLSYRHVKSEGLRLYADRIWRSVLVGASSLLPFLALIPLIKILGERVGNVHLLVLSIWILLLALNAQIASLGQGDIMAVGLMAAVLLFVALPLGLDRTSQVSGAVAENIGIKSDGQIVLLVSRPTCDLLQAARQAADLDRSSYVCSDNGANAVTAQVLSNVGSRWVLGLTTDDDQTRVVRVTVPSEGIQVLIKPNAPSSRACPA
jgi:hypothetical protein